MSKELVVSSNQHETRLAILEDDRLVEIYLERRANHAIAGSIYKGRVSRVLPGMQSAFVKIGLTRDAFLYVSDVLDQTADLERGDDPDAADAPASEGQSQDRGGRGGSGRGRGGRSDSRRRDSGRPERSSRQKGERELGFRPKEVKAPLDEPATGEARAAQENPGESGKSDDRQSGRRRGRRRRGRRGRDDDREATGAVADAPREEQREGDGDVRREDRAEDSAREEPREATTVSDDDDRDFAVLPGESLAKYSAPAEEPELEDDKAVEDLGRDGEVDDGNEYDDEEDGNKQGDEQDDEQSDEPEDDQQEPTDDGRVVEDDQESEDEEELDDDIEYDDEVEDEGEEPAAASADSSGTESGDSEEIATELAGADGEADDDAEGTAEEVEESEAETDTSKPLDASSDADDRSLEMPGEPQPESEETAPEIAAEVRGTSESSGFQRRGRRGRRRRRDQGSNDAQPQESTQGKQRNNSESETVKATAQDQVLPSDGLPNIRDLLDPGQELIVQIAKEPLGKKGARITANVALPGRFMVYMPTVNHNGVSRKIQSDAERARLRRVVKAHAEGKPGGFIVRTAGRGASDEELQADVDFLFTQWQGILAKAETAHAPALLYHDLDVVERVMRDQLGQNYKTIWVDGEEEYERVLRFVERFEPDLLDRVKLYTRAMPIYDEFNISQEIEKALRPKVWLKSGGYLVINQTEALVAIDVNTGKYVGKSDRLEDTILKTNMEAAEEVVRQMRLRDLGGIIIIDFIDMEDRKNRHGVHQTLEAALRRDRAPSKALPFNDFGLIAITRKRIKQSLERALCTPCPTCAGSGSVKSVPTVVGEILNESRKLAVGGEQTRDVVLIVHPEVAKVLKSRSNTHLQELEETFKANVLVRGDVEMHPDQYNFH